MRMIAAREGMFRVLTAKPYEELLSHEEAATMNALEAEDAAALIEVLGHSGLLEVPDG